MTGRRKLNGQMINMGSAYRVGRGGVCDRVPRRGIDQDAGWGAIQGAGRGEIRLGAVECELRAHMHDGAQGTATFGASIILGRETIGVAGRV